MLTNSDVYTVHIYIDCWLDSNVFFHGACAYARVYIRVVQQTARQTNREACHEHPVSSSIIKRQPSCPTGREVSANFHPGVEGGGGGGWGEDLI